MDDADPIDETILAPDEVWVTFEPIAVAPRGRDRTWKLALFASVVLHVGLISWAVYSFQRLLQPMVALQAGTGGDGITAVDFPIYIATPQPICDAKLDPLAEDAVKHMSVEFNEFVGETVDTIQNASQPLRELGDSESSAAWIGPSQQTDRTTTIGTVPRAKLDPTRFAASGGADATNQATAGSGGADGNGFADAMPTPGARNKPPRYPVDAKRAGIEGTVTLEVEVLTTGKVGAIDIINTSGNESLDRAAIEAVHAWQFNPATAAGQPVPCHIRLPIRFVLR